MAAARAAHDAEKREWKDAQQAQVQELLGEARAALEARSAEKRTREIEVVVAKLGTEMTLASKAAQARTLVRTAIVGKRGTQGRAGAHRGEYGIAGLRHLVITPTRRASSGRWPSCRRGTRARSRSRRSSTRSSRPSTPALTLTLTLTLTLP